MSFLPNKEMNNAWPDNIIDVNTKEYLDSLTDNDLKIDNIKGIIKNLMNFCIEPDYIMPIVNAILNNKELAMDILRNPALKCGSKVFYLQYSLWFEGDSFEELNSDIKDMFDMDAIVYDPYTRYKEVLLVRNKFPGISLERIKDVVLNRPAYTSTLLYFSDHKLESAINDPHCEMYNAKLIETNDLADAYIKYPSYFDITEKNTFKADDAAKLLKAVAELNDMFPTDKQHVFEIMGLYGNNQVVLTNYITVQNILNGPGDRFEKSKALARKINKKLITVAAPYSINDIDKAKNKLVKYCTKTAKPIDTAKNLFNTVEDMRKDYPFLKDSIDRLESLASSVYDEVVNIISAEKEKNADKQRLLKEKEQKKLIPIATEVIRKYTNVYADTPISVARYCSDNNIERAEFDRYVDIVEVESPDLFYVYRECTKKTSAKAFHIMNNAMMDVIHALNDNPKLSMFEYYRITKFEPDSLLKIASNSDKVSKQEFIKFKRFYTNKVKKAVKRSPQFFMDTHTIIKGKPLSEDDISTIIVYMKKNRMPFIESIFFEAARLHVAGKLEEK